jgi:hypothetical protein
MPSINYIPSGSSGASVVLTPTYVGYGSSGSGITGQSNFNYDNAGHLGIGKTYTDHGGYGNTLDMAGGIAIQRTSDASNTYLLAAFTSGGTLIGSVYMDMNAGSMEINNNQNGQGFQFNSPNVAGTVTQAALNYNGLIITAAGSDYCQVKVEDGGGDVTRIMSNGGVGYVEALTTGGSPISMEIVCADLNVHNSQLGFYSASPVNQQSSTGITTVAQLVTVLKNYGLLS